MASEAIRLEIGKYLEDFHWSTIGLRELSAGPVMRDLVRRAIRVENHAKRNATNRPGPMVRTGRLRGSITWRPGNDELSPYVDIGSAVLYAPYVELGTSRMPAYPYLRPALESARAAF